MKQNVKTFTKRNKIIAILIAILLACCLTVSGIMLFKGQKSSSVNAASPNTTVSIVTKNAAGQETTNFAAGDTVYTSVTFTTVRQDLNWISIACAISPTDTSITQYLSFPDDFDFDRNADPYTKTGFRSGGYSTLSATFDSRGMVFALAIGTNTSQLANTSSVDHITFVFELVISEEFTGNQITFDVPSSAANKVTFKNGLAGASATDNAEVGTLACTPVTLTIGEGGGEETKDNDTSIKTPTASMGGTNVPLTASSDGSTFTGAVSDLNGKVTINVTANGKNAEVTGAGQVDLSTVTANADGTKTVTVTVKAEDGTTKPYTFTFSRKKSSTFAITVTATGGAAPQTWTTPGTYTYTVPYSTTSVTLSASATSPATVASGSATGVKSNLSVGDNGPYKIWGIAEDNTNTNGASAFNIKIVRQSNTFNMSVTASATGATSQTWNTPGDYTFTVPYNTTSATLSATAQSPATIATGSQNGTKTNLSVGDNGPYKIWAVAQDGTNSNGATAFNITIVRLSPPADNTFNMTVTATANGSTLGSWSTPNSYTLTVPYDTTSVNLSATAQSPATVATDSQTGTKTLSVGDNGPYKIWAVAQDKTNSDGASAFNITIVRAPKPADNTFNMTVTATAAGVSEKTWSTPGNYSFTVPNETEFVNISAVAQLPATVADDSQTGTQALEVGSNTFKVWAVAEDKTNSDGAIAFNITIVREEAKEPVDGAPLLSDLRIDNYDDGNGYTVKNFDPDNLGIYKVYVPSNADHPRITALAANDNAEIVMKVKGEVIDRNTGTATDVASLEEIGSSITVEIIVTLNGESNTYTLTVIRASETPYLTYLTVGSYQIFDGNKKPVNGKDEAAVRDVPNFYVTIENADTKVVITAKSSEDDVEVKINGTVVGNGGGVLDASIGLLKFEGATAEVQISIYPQFGETVVHYLYITRKPALSSNTNAGITIDEITTEYNATIFNTEYAENSSKLFYGTYHVPYTVSTLKVTVTVEDLGPLVASATYEIYYDTDIQTDATGKKDEKVKLAYGCNHVHIHIIASDGTVRPIVVSVIREKPALYPNPTIEEISEFTDEYRADVTNYKYVVAHDVTKLTIHANWDQTLYDCVITGADNLKTGLNTVTISLIEKNQGVSRTAVSAENKDAARTITIDVYREGNNISTVWLILFILFLLLAIIEAIIVAVLMMRRKNEPTTPQRVVVATPPAPAPIVNVQPPVHYIPAPQPQVQYVQVPAPQPVEVEKPQQPVNVEVKITGCGDSDGYYKTKK